ncbi:MAG: hypothetical protein WAM14_25415 [Candidatus Nitrosopolaris sp.]
MGKDRVYGGKLKAYMPSLKENINIVINVRAETKDIHILCTKLDKDIVTIIRYALKRFFLIILSIIFDLYSCGTVRSAVVILMNPYIFMHRNKFDE